MKILLPLVFAILLLVNLCFSTSVSLVKDTGSCSYLATDGKTYDLSSIGYLEYEATKSIVSSRIYGVNLCAALTGTQPCGGNPKPAYLCQQDSSKSQIGIGIVANSVNLITQPGNTSLISLQYTGTLCGMKNMNTVVNIKCGPSNSIVSAVQDTPKASGCSPTNTIVIQSDIFCPSSSKSGLSGGDICLIIFFCGFGAYFIFGVGIQCYRGKRRVEAVPNIEFWKNFGALIKDGVDFIKSKIFRSVATAGYQQIP
ncbi:hypothetical protein RB653_004345 [Dictyostelium firmibasis]|uniref:MRH domain-containing protein n=1 Tax=Dictyostelium firmibasis TaxID=79012 RepID=A0AAN7TZB9_9MYCE